METDQTERIERIEVFEEKFGVKFDGLYAAFGEADEHGALNVFVRGEAHARDKSSKIKQCLELVAVAYDEKGRVLGKGNQYIGRESFFAFDVFEIDLYGVPRTPARIKLYPKAT